jgi:transglutaminase-like putative cysteine protease
MATQRNTLVSVTRAALTLAAAVGLLHVFAGASWLATIAVAALAPALLCAALDRRRAHPAATFAVLVAAGVWLGIVVDDPSATLSGIPTGEALATFARDLAKAPDVLRSAVVPVEPAGAALLLAVVATYVAAAATELLGRRADVPVGAIGPSVALYVAIAALASGSWVAATALFALATVAYLVAVHHAEGTARRTWFQSARGRRSRVLAGGMVAGTVAVAFAVSAGPAFPGARGEPLLDYRDLGRGQGQTPIVAKSPLVSIAGKLNVDPDREYFKVDSGGRRLRWRTMALDVLELDRAVEGWTVESAQGSPDDLEGPSNARDAERVVQRVEIAVEADRYWLPAAYRPLRIELDGAATLPGSGTLLLNRSLTGVEYEVESEVRAPSPDALRSVTFAELGPMRDATRLPPRYSSRVKQLALELTRDAPTPYDRAMALQDFFQSDDFAYDQSVEYSPAPRVVESFVFDRRRGFCQQFATAFTEMARAAALPARVAVGYQPGTLGDDGRFHVAGRDAHAWPEVWLGEEFGWTAFEPTKGRVDPVSGRGSPGGATPGGTTATTATTTASTPASTGSTPTTRAPTPSPEVRVAPPPAEDAGGGHEPPALAVAAVVLAAVVGAALAAAGLLTAGALRRTHRRRTASDPRRRVLGAWTEALERLGAAGVSPRPAATPVEFARRHAPAHGAGDAGAPLLALARLQTAALFAPDPPSVDDAEAAWAHVDAITAALRTRVPRTERWISRLRVRRRDRLVDELIGPRRDR